MKTIFTWILGLVVLIGLMAGAYYLNRKGHGPEDPKAPTGKAEPKDATPVVITAENSVSRPVQRIVRVVGSLYGQEEITITPKVEGKIVKIHVDVGDRVKPGAVILEVDETDYRLAVSEAERGLELELAKLGLKDFPGDKFDVSQLPSVVKAAFLEKNTLSRKDRLNRLGGGLVTSPEEREQADTDHKVAKANYQQAVLEAMTTLASAEHKKAILDTARQRLADTKVTAPPLEGPTKPTRPVEYAISQRMASVGELLKSGPGTNLSVFKMVIDNPLKLQATVPERHLSEIRVGQVVQIEVESHRNTLFQGRVSRVNPMVDRSNRTFSIEVEVPNDQKKLFAGSFAKASILTEIDPQALTVPEEAIISFAGVTKVFVVRDGKAIDVSVVPGSRLVLSENGKETAWVEVKGNLKPGEPVVTSGHSRLSDGRTVKFRDDGPGSDKGRVSR